jgi:hypothetical protein
VNRDGLVALREGKVGSNVDDGDREGWECDIHLLLGLGDVGANTKGIETKELGLNRLEGSIDLSGTHIDITWSIDRDVDTVIGEEL